MKVDQIRGLSDEEIIARLDEAREEIMNLRFQQATGELLDTSQLGKVRKNIARFETILKEREMEGDLEGES
jgi:large subunit ribosomal protein L29